jgi:hypothetical protein
MAVCGAHDDVCKYNHFLRIHGLNSTNSCNLTSNHPYVIMTADCLLPRSTTVVRWNLGVVVLDVVCWALVVD